MNKPCYLGTKPAVWVDWDKATETTVVVTKAEIPAITNAAICFCLLKAFLISSITCNLLSSNHGSLVYTDNITKESYFYTITWIQLSIWDIQLVKIQLRHDTLNIEPFIEIFASPTKRT